MSVVKQDPSILDADGEPKFRKQFKALVEKKRVLDILTRVAFNDRVTDVIVLQGLGVIVFLTDPKGLWAIEDPELCKLVEAWADKRFWDGYKSFHKATGGEK
jgi:hypothetical protein